MALRMLVELGGLPSNSTYDLEAESGKPDINTVRRMAENGFAPPPLGNFADMFYLVEN